MIKTLVTLKDYIKGETEFQFYRSGNLYYKTENGFIFGVPTSDTDDAIFLKKDKGIYFMRWIRKALNELECDTK